MRKTLLAIVAGLMFAGCSWRPVTTKYTKVVRVFMHRPGQYSIMTEENGELKSENFSDMSTFKVVADVKPGDEMWAVWTNNGSMNEDYIEIHVHSAADIGGGSFKVGKAPEYTTTPLETK